VTVALADRGYAAIPTHVIGMSQKRRAPCDHAVNPGSFGKPSLIAWVPADPSDLTEQAELLAAQWQHALAVEIRAGLVALLLSLAVSAVSWRTWSQAGADGDAKTGPGSAPGHRPSQRH
jgi:hypothetical protein